MSDSIKLSPKYGLNPTIPVCFFCSEPKNMIAMMGHVYENDNGRKKRGSDVEMKMYSVLDYEPCDNCKKKLEEEDKILLCEVNNHPVDHRPPIDKDFYPTGRYIMIPREAINIQTPKSRMMLMTEEDFSTMFVNN